MGRGGGKWQPPACLGLAQSGLSPLSDSLGALKDDMLLLETRGPQDNRSLCALEPSGCTPLLSQASTVRTRASSSMYLSSSISSLASDFHCIQFPLLCARPCSALWECGGYSDLGPVLSDLLEVSNHSPSLPQLFCKLKLGGLLSMMPLGDNLPLVWQRAARLGEQLLQDLQSGQCLQVSGWQEGPAPVPKANRSKTLYLTSAISSCA